MKVDIVDFPATPVAMIEHRGPSALVNETAARFIEWRKTSGLSPVRSSRTFGIAPHDPATTEAQDFRFFICGEVTAPILEDNAFGVVNSTLPAGAARCCAITAHWMGSRKVPIICTASGCRPAARSCAIFRSISTTTTSCTKWRNMNW